MTTEIIEFSEKGSIIHKFTNQTVEIPGLNLIVDDNIMRYTEIKINTSQRLDFLLKMYFMILLGARILFMVVTHQ